MIYPQFQIQRELSKVLKRQIINPVAYDEAKCDSDPSLAQSDQGQDVITR